MSNTMFDRRNFLKGSMAALAAASMPEWLTAAANASPSKRPNVVCIFSDEINFSYLGCWGGDFKTPNIDSIARDGMKFKRAYCTSPMCTPSRFSILTGCYPSRCDDPHFKEEFSTDEPPNIAWNSLINEKTVTLPKLLSANGYTTGMAGKWHLGPHVFGAHPSIVSDSDPKNPAVDASLRERQKRFADAVKRDGGFDYAASVVWGNFDEEPIKALAHHNIPWITKGAVEFLEQNAKKEKPFFLYLTPTTIHGPQHQLSLEKDLSYTPAGHDSSVLKYAPDSAKLKALTKDKPSWFAHQRVGMAYLDHQVGIILDKIKELGVERETIVLYMPDHNIEPGKAVCYEKGYRVPLIIKWPGHVPPSSECDAVVQGVDLFSTIALIAGVPEKNRGTPDAFSFANTLKNPKDSGDRKWIYYESGYARGISDGKYKLIVYRPPEKIIQAMKDGKKEGAINYLNRKKQDHSQVAMMHFPHYFDQDQFYNLEKDPCEQRNLAGDPLYSKQVEEFKKCLRDKLDSFPNPYPLEKIPFLDSQEYRDMAARQKALGTDKIEWLKRDHGKIVWPPTGKAPSGVVPTFSAPAKAGGGV